MPRLNSCHLPAEHWPAGAGARATLEGPEARHLLGVLRAKPGDAVRLFDGAGRWGLFDIAETQGKSSAVLKARELRHEPRPASGLVLALGWSKSSRRDWILEKAVELDAYGLVFWRAARSQGDVPSDAKASWREKCVQAAKQCGAVWLPELSVLHDGLDGLQRIAATHDGCYILDENADPGRAPDLARLGAGRDLVVIGPEGGLERHEADRLTATGFVPVSLGPRPLRWETAALYCLGLAHHAARSR